MKHLRSLKDGVDNTSVNLLSSGTIGFNSATIIVLIVVLSIGAKIFGRRNIV